MGSNLTTRDVARHFGVAVQTVCVWCAKGWLKAIKLGRDWVIERVDMESFRLPTRGRPLAKGRG